MVIKLFCGVQTVTTSENTAFSILLTDLNLVIQTFRRPIKCSRRRQTFTRWQRRNRKCRVTEICAKQSIWQILKQCT